ncbi:hypothetical protein Dda3937_00094 [Dickeya dadantii 3937]|uniref:Uncharacterized protein n=1 Tax=Dickeya dadantii (strain 3937) TaxID=198628 RepID=E0SG29_DICD3|nr:hypothetical protein Dda3937_00094 [Dickeya dadantii 3937]
MRGNTAALCGLACARLKNRLLKNNKKSVINKRMIILTECCPQSFNLYSIPENDLIKK